MSTVPLFIILSLQKRKCYLIYKTNSFPDSEIKITDFFFKCNQYQTKLVAGSIPKAKHALWLMPLLPEL